MSRQASMTEESRLQIAVVAGATERSNRPRFLLLLAAVALAAAAIYAGLGAQRLLAARADARRELETAALVNRLVEDLRAAKAARKDDGAAPDPQAAQKLQQLASDVGLRSAVRLSSSQQADAPGYVRKRYDARGFRVSDIGPVIDWLQQATGTNSVGLTNIELNSVRLRPLRTGATGGWEADVTFTRLERDR